MEAITKVSGTESTTQVKNLKRKEYVSEESKQSKFSRFVRKSKEVAIGALIGLAVASGAHAQNYTTKGNQILDPNGNVYYIHGVNRSGFEITSNGDDGAGGVNHWQPSDFQAIASWGANTVRIPVNQEFWLSDSPCYDPKYPTTFANVAQAAHAAPANLNVIFDLHQNFGLASIPQGMQCPVSNGQQVGQQLMADARSITFWQGMAAWFADDPKVFLELYNEPGYPGSKGLILPWGCWQTTSNCSSPWVGAGYV